MRGKRSNPNKIGGRVTITRNGKEYMANWEISGGMITVWHPEFSTKSTHFTDFKGPAGSHAEAFARLLLSEMLTMESTGKASDKGT